ncbi:hypothetical protein V2J09_000889 [Rumex salicifolius]
MAAIATAAALSLPFSLFRCSKLNTKKEEGGGLVPKKSSWGPNFNVEDPRLKAPQYKGKFLDCVPVKIFSPFLFFMKRSLYLYHLLSQSSFISSLQFFVEVLRSLACEYKSIGTMKKDLAGLQEDLAQANRQVHISEARV